MEGPFLSTLPSHCNFVIFYLQLTICDTVGYGDQVNKEDSFKAVVDYIDAQFEAYLQEELKIKRSLPTYHDSRLHVCLYFICPTGECWTVFVCENVETVQDIIRDHSSIT